MPTARPTAHPRPAGRARRRPPVARSSSPARRPARATGPAARCRTRKPLPANASRSVRSRLGDAGVVEGGHRRQHRDRGAHHRQCHRGAGALAEAQTQIDDRRPGPSGPAPACGPVRWSGARPATRPVRPAPAARPTRAAAVTTRPSSSSGSAPDRGLRAETGHRGQIRAAAGPQQRDRIGPQPARPRYIASRTAAVLRDQPASSMPVPRPTTATGSVSVSVAINVVAAVVFPMPMSPAISRSAPASTSSSAIRRPASSAASTSSSLSASSTAMLPLERRTL